MRITALCFVLALFGLGACSGAEGTADARAYQDPDIDARPFPGFRDGGCGSGTSGSSGTSGAGCGDALTAPIVDAAPPDATPACEFHTFTYEDAAATTVWVTGSFSAWATMPPGAVPLAQSGTTFSVTLQLGPGQHQYKLIVDGDTWITDPANPDTVDDGFGGANSVIVLCQ